MAMKGVTFMNSRAGSAGGGLFFQNVKLLDPAIPFSNISIIGCTAGGLAGAMFVSSGEHIRDSALHHFALSSNSSSALYATPTKSKS